jgi:DNA-binding transcriptional LysR family regulator
VHHKSVIDHRLFVLQALAEHGTVTATADALNYTPSAVSAQLRGLAEQLGVALLEHEGRRVRLTPAARLLVERSADLNRAWEEILGEIADRADLSHAALRLCGFSTPTAAILPTLATRLRALRPHLLVRIDEADPATCFEMLHTEAADLAVVVVTQDVPTAADPRFEQRTLLADPLDLLVREDHPMAARTSLDLVSLASEAWITDHVGSAYHQLFLTACLSAGFVPDIAHHASEWDTAAALVAAGLGVALIPRLAKLPESYPVHRVRLHGDSAPSRSVIVAMRAGCSGHPLIVEALDGLRVLASEASLAIA